jgi:hypothetical protein
MAALCKLDDFDGNAFMFLGKQRNIGEKNLRVNVASQPFYLNRFLPKVDEF